VGGAAEHLATGSREASSVKRLRVVQWTTGRTGSAAVRATVRHPQLELVGCYAWSADKVGQDAGVLCGLEPLGVIATADVDALLALEPDCVIYMPYRPDIDHVVRILEVGCNLVSTLYMLSGIGYGDDAASRIKAAALKGRSSLYASGVYPGHLPMVSLAVSAMCERIDQISLLEALDMSGYANERMFRAMGIDLEPDDPHAAVATEASCGSFKDQVRVLAHALAVELDAIDFRAEFAVANEDLDFGYMTVRKGRIAGIKGTIAGTRHGRSLLECRSVWKMGRDGMKPNWPVINGYVIEVVGSPSFECRLAPTEGHLDGAVTTAMPVVNSIPAVVAAEPGIVNYGQLPLVTARHLVVID
jgi:2,4-diaminopentanoate dehydrogenase